MSRTRSTLLDARGLTKIYSMGKVRVAALNGVDLSVDRGDFLGISGASGSGKSTLMNLLGGLDSPTQGTIQFGGKFVSDMNSSELALYRRQSVGMIFQSFNLISSLSAWENVALPLLFSGVPKKERRNRACELLQQVGLEQRLDHKPAEMSGGEQQRVAIARALVNRPKLVLADEPTGNLDSRTSRDIIQLLADLKGRQSLAVILVSHEKALLDEYAQTILNLRDGEVVPGEGSA
jgi:putative ABC transport system ATP-binding protein